MKLKLVVINLILLLVSIICLFMPISTGVFAETNNSDFYWSVNNAPVFYGATKIILPTSVDDFNILDSKYRIFAKDFEDGDLTTSIEVISNNVQVGVVGSYEIKYKIIDSHNNITSLTVPVVIEDNTSNQITIERTLYTVPSVWNMDMAGFSRCNYGDRQILGVYLSKGTKFKIRAVDVDKNLNINMLGNDSYNESSSTLLPTNTEFIEIGNSKDCASVPLITTPVMARGSGVCNQYKIEIQFDKNVSSLNYYHYKDNEENFYNTWRTCGNEFSVIENEAFTIIVPFADIDKLNIQNPGFSTLDAHLEYYLKVVNKMDEIIGLSLNPTKSTDQNVRTKYLVKANVHGAGAAYYSGNHIGINSASISAFFQMNWGGLHEIAHGYQGYLGKGSMGLGEVANNILGYYIQTDKDIFSANINWLGELKNIETNINAQREAGISFTEIDVNARLYALINLLDTFEGEKTYAKLFSWYREKLNVGEFTSNTPNQDIYALFFKDVYRTNILPYWNAWGLNVSNEVVEDIADSDLRSLTILGDAVNTANLENILSLENLELKYGLVDTKLLEKYNITSNLKITIEIDDINAVKGKKALIFENGKVIDSQVILNNILEFNNLPTSSYYIKLPVKFEYETEFKYITLTQGDNEITCTYSKIASDFHSTYLQITGPYKTNGYKLELSNNNTKATIQLGQASLGNQNSTWENKPNEVFVSVTIKDSNGVEVKKNEVLGNGYFTTTSVPAEELSLGYGYTIEIFTNAPNYVGVYSNITKSKIEEYNSTSNNIKYIVTIDGLKLDNNLDFNTNLVLYNHIKDNYIKVITDYIVHTEEYPEELSNKFINISRKTEVVKAYNFLNTQDKAPYTEFLNKIIQGGTPQVSPTQSKITINVGDNVNVLDYLVAIDNEDNVIELNSQNTSILGEIDNNQVGEYKLICSIFDSDGNETTTTLIVEVRSSTITIILVIIVAVVLIGGVILLVGIVAKKKS